jgi:cytochrome b
VVSPMTTLRYLRKPWQVLGHNPLGAWSVLALLGLVLLQAFTGWGTSDEIAFDGPLVRHLSEQWVSILGSIHLATEPLLFGLVGLHVLAIVYYRRVKKEALLPAMIHGDQVRSDEEARLLLAQKQRPASDDAGLRVKGLIAYLISLALVLSAYYLSL